MRLQSGGTLGSRLERKTLDSAGDRGVASSGMRADRGQHQHDGGDPLLSVHERDAPGLLGRGEDRSDEVGAALGCAGDCPHVGEELFTRCLLPAVLALVDRDGDRRGGPQPLDRHGRLSEDVGHATPYP